MTRLLASRRLLHLGLLITVGAGLGLIARSWVPAAAMVPLAGALLFAFVEVLLPMPTAGQRRIELGNQLLVSDEPTIEVALKPALLPYNLKLRDGIPEGFSLQPGSPKAFAMQWDGSAAAQYTLKVRRRGDYAFDPALVQRNAMLGLFERTLELPIPTVVTVLPASAKNLGVRVRPRPPARAGRVTRAVRRGPGDEFFALREYQPGDNLGDVNWKATARMQRIITNEFLPDEPPRYLLYVDTRASVAEFGEADVFERTLELAAVLVEALIEARAHVGLVLLSYHSLFLVPGGGAGQLRRLRRMIIDARPGYEASMQQLVLAGVPHLPSRADAILITANVYDPTLGNAVTFLRARHGRCAILAPAFPEPAGDELENAAQRASSRLLNAEQGAALAGLRQLADEAVQWPPEEPIPVTLSHLGMTGRTR